MATASNQSTDRDTVQAELIGLEKRYWQAMKDRDVETAMRLTDFPCIVTGPRGVASIDRESFAAMMGSQSHAIRDVRIDDDVKVRLLGEDTAVVAYKVHTDLTVDGKDVSIDASDVSTWVRKDGTWVCAQHSESIQGDA